MRLVLRVLLGEFALTSAVLLAGWIRLAAQIWPFARDSLRAGFRGRAWRAGLGLLVGLPVVAGWPVLFLVSPVWAAATHGDWLKIAIPWWLIVGAGGAVVLVAELTAARTERETECQCAGCTAYSQKALSS
jgi:hypothetical protein